MLESDVPKEPTRWQHWTLLAQAWFLHALFDLRIRFGRYDRWKSLCSPSVKSVAAPIPATKVIQFAEQAARHHCFPVNCLRRCLVQLHLLAKQGHAGRLHIGVRKSKGFEAHCWLTLDGQLINDSDENVATYSELVTHKDPLSLFRT